MHFRNLLIFAALAVLLIDQCLAGTVKAKRKRSEKAHRREETREERRPKQKSSESRERPEQAYRDSRSVSDDEDDKPEYTIRRVPSYKYYLEQSPIHIKSMSQAVGFDRLLKPLRFSYQPTTNYLLKNYGNGFIVKFGDNHDSFVSGGPLDQPYYLANMQIRWGTKDNLGSEHRVNGRAYAGEVQLVHYNRNKYGTYDEAAKHGDGLAVVSVFLKLSFKTNHAIHTLVRFLPKIMKEGKKIELHHALNLPGLLPNQYQKFWTYPGSLTTRPFTENAIWIILRNPVEFSKKELYGLRKFRPSNRRRLQPLNDRVIRSSFHKLGKLGKW